MKKTLLVIGAIFLVILVTLAAVPFLFKDQIKEGVDGAIADAVNADVYYENFQLSLLTTFPNLGLAADKVGIVGQNLFLGDTLLYANKARVKLNLLSVLFGDQVKIQSVDLESPKILVKVLDDGTANYDIAATDDSTGQEEATAYDIKIKHWEIRDGSFIYDDQQVQFYVALDQVTHQGSGDFNEAVFDLSTTTEGHVINTIYEDISYLSDKQVIGDVTLEVNLPELKYTFKENRVSINEFAFGFDGWLALDDASDDITMDLNFAAQQNDFKSLLSCVPGMYTENFEDVDSEGQVQFAGSAEGTYSATTIPAFTLDFKVIEGRFKYPDLPKAVENINMDLTLANSSGQAENTLIDIKQLHLDFGDNPVDGHLRLEGLKRSQVDADVKARLDLAEITEMVPMQGTSLRGDFNLALEARGIYDSAARKFPQVKADMTLNEGFVKSDQFPEALEQINLTSRVRNSNGSMQETLIEVPNFSFVMDGEPFSGNLALKDLADYQWDLFVDGTVDLEKLTHIFPQEGITMKGRIKGNLATKGRMSDLDAERYQLLPTSGNFEITNFTYQDGDLAHPFHIKTGRASFDPQKITLQGMQAETGSSDLQVQGNLTNYMNYVFKEEAAVKGNLNLTSNNLDLNEWMTETADTSAAPMEVLEIPKTVDLSINSQVGTVHYDNLTLSNVIGGVKLNNGIASLQEVTFNSLGGRFAVNGNYDSRDLKHPKFDLNVGIADVGVKNAFDAFNTVKVFAPIAKLVDGDFNSTFNLSGELGQDMMPLLNTLSGSGLVEILEAALAGVDSKIVQGLNNLTKFSQKTSNFSLKDVIMQFQIANGKLNLKPFDVTFGDYKTKVTGSTGIDGSIAFLLNMEVPAGVIGSSVNNAIARLTGSQEATTDVVKLNLNLGGTYNDPTFAIGGREGGATTASAAQDAVDQKVDEAKDSVRTVVDEKAEEVKEKGKATLDSLLKEQVKDSAANEAVREVKDKILKDKSVDDVLDIFKKKKKPSADSTAN